MKLFKYLLILILVVFAAAFFYMNTIFKSVAEEVGSEMTGTNVSISVVSINPLGGSILISGVSVGNPDGFKSKNAIEFSSLSAAVDLGSVFSDVIKVSEVRLANPKIYYEVGVRGDNIRKLMGNVEKNSKKSGGTSSKSKSSGSSQKVVIENLYLTDGEIELAVNMLGLKAGQAVPFPDMHMKNIGGGNKGGTSVGKVTSYVFSKIAKQAVSLKNSGFGGLTDGLKDGMKGFGDSLKDSGGKAVDKLKSLF